MSTELEKTDSGIPLELLQFISIVNIDRLYLHVPKPIPNIVNVSTDGRHFKASSASKG